METQTLNFDVASDWTLSDASLIEVTSGVIRLKDLGGTTYSTASPNALYNTNVTANRILKLNEYSTKPTNTEVLYTIFNAGLDYYFDGNNWVTSNGTVSQANTAATLIPQLERLKIESFQIRIFLKTTSASVRPEVTKLELMYDSEPSLSKSYNFNRTRNSIIEEAFRAVGAMASGVALTNDQIARGESLLNDLLASWRSSGISVWNEEKFVIPLHASSVALGSDGLDYECIETHMSTNNNKPKTGNQYMSYWKALTTSAGAAHDTNKRYVSSNQYELPNHIFALDHAFIREGVDLKPLIITTTFEDYKTQLNNDSTGKPTRLYFRKGSVPQVFILPYPDDSTKYVLELNCLTYPQDFDSGSNNPDILREFNLALIYNLALLIAPSRGVSAKQYGLIKDLANDHLKNARMHDHEMGDIQFTLGGYK